MTFVHPRFVGTRATILVNFHGSDTYRFSSDNLDPVERVDRFGYRHRYKTLTKGLQSFFTVPKKSPLYIVGLWLSVGSIEVWEAQHMAYRLRLERVAGFGDDELDITKIEHLPTSLKAKGIKFFP